MKEIGETFKEAREKIGLSIDEVCSDLEVTAAQIDNLEAGNINAFKDVFFLKDLIASYAKYLNLDAPSIVEAYDSFMFDYTTKISMDDILTKTRELEIKEKDQKRIISPYTKKIKDEKKGRWLLVGIIGLIALIVLGIVIYNLVDRPIDNRNKISYVS